MDSIGVNAWISVAQGFYCNVERSHRQRKEGKRVVVPSLCYSAMKHGMKRSLETTSRALVTG